jgi:DNA-binding YbaB/EbfC family protein
MSDIEQPADAPGFDPQALLAQALEMQQQLMAAQADAAAETVEGTSGGGKVKVTMTGAGEVTAIRIDPSVVLPDDVEMLEDLLLAAVHDASARATELAREAMGGLGGLLGGLGA